MINHKSLPVDQCIVYFDSQTGFSFDKIRKSFRNMDIQEIAALNPGDTVWIDVNINYPNKKILCFEKRKIKKITQIKKNIFYIYFEQGGYKKFYNIEGCYNDFFTIDNELTLLKIINNNPVNTEI